MKANAQIKIEKSIPMKGVASTRNKYPFRDMAVGGSFLFPSGYANSHYYGMSREFTAAFMVAGERRLFKTRKTPEGYRCWRVE